MAKDAKMDERRFQAGLKRNCSPNRMDWLRLYSTRISGPAFTAEEEDYDLVGRGIAEKETKPGKNILL